LLTERREKLETVLDSISDGILFLDTRGNINVFNYALSDLFGLGKDALGRSVEGLPVDLPLRQALSRAEEGFPHSTGTAGHAQQPGARCDQSDRGCLRCWSAGRSEKTPAHCYDCTAYRIGREFLEQPKDVLWNERIISVTSSFIELREVNELWEVVIFHDASSEKLDAALKVAGAAAHELRQPLQVVLMLAEMLKKSVGESDSGQRHLEVIKSSCVRMDDIIKKMCMITSYRIKDYTDGIKILDFDKSTNAPEGGAQ